ncbi:MAG: hypothetical protein Tsb0026_01320 [Sulfuricaulis sp.]
METSDPKYKHKPSEKHTLEEVLKSLQDLVRNDLTEGASDTATPKSPPTVSRQHEGASRRTTEAQPRHENTSNLREDFAPASPGSGPVNLDAVMRSLKDLIGNELNVGDEPGPASKKSVPIHDEYLSVEEKIEEYIPEELSRLDAELNIGEERIPEESEPAPPRDASLAPEESIEESLPEELTPLDEALTFETPLEPAPVSATPSETMEVRSEIPPALDQNMGESAPEEFTPLDEELTFDEPLEPTALPVALTESTELPGEISLEFLEEPEPPPPAPIVPPPAPQQDLAPGTQKELFFEDALLHAPESGAVTTDSAPATAMDSMPTPESQASEDKREQPVEMKPESEAEALPTIEVEESFDDNDYFSTSPSGEPPPPASEETIALDAEISPESEIVAPPVAETTAVPTEPAGEKITLEIASEPAPEKAQDKYSVDFDSLDLTSPLPEKSELSPPEGETARDSKTPAATAEADRTPATASEAAAAPLEPSTVGPKAKTSAEPQQTAETATPETPPSFNIDDIPVLNEIVAPPAGSVSVAKPATPSPASALPAPDRARDIVVRAVAKLNVEMRKTGGAGLDTRTILRLQQLIRQELEKGGEK